MSKNRPTEQEITHEIPRSRTRGATQEINRRSDRAQVVVLCGVSKGKSYSLGPDSLIGRQPGAAVWLPDEGISRRHARIRQTEAGGFEIENLGSRNGTWVNGVEITVQPLTFGDKISLGGDTILVFTHTDPLEDDVQHLQKMEAVGRLSSGVAHEFNNLLAVVLNNLAALKEPTIFADDGERAACLDEARRATLRGAELTRQLLDFSRLSNSDRQPTDLSALVQEVATLCRRTFGPRIEITTNIARHLTVSGDRLQLYQVLMNLCINARDAMPDGGQLRIDAVPIEPAAGNGATRDEPEAVLITIRDTGCGMDPTTLERVFEPFFSTKAPGKGTGLGLSMVLGIVNNHGGKIEIDSDPRRGSVVRLTFSLTEEDPEPTGTGRRVVPTRELDQGPATILVVDDDEMVLSSTTRLIRALGHQVLTALDGMAAVRLYEQHRGEIGLVLLDVMMPTLGGLETFCLLKRIDPNVKVVACSGYTEKSATEQLLASGARGFLAKPYRVKALKEALQSALDPVRNTLS